MFFYFYGQTTSKSVTVNHIQSFSINIPHTVMCTFVLLKWIYGMHKKCSLLHFSTFCHPNCCHSLHQVIQTEVQCYIDNMTKHLVCEQWHKDIRHARCEILPPLSGQGQYSLWCWRGSLACPRPKTGRWGRIIIFVVVCCIVLYSTVH